AADAGLLALRARRHRLERPAAQRLARNPAAVTRRAGDPGGGREARPADARGTRREAAGEIRYVLDGVRPRAEGGLARGSVEHRSDREAAALLIHPRGLR